MKKRVISISSVLFLGLQAQAQMPSSLPSALPSPTHSVIPSVLPSPQLDAKKLGFFQAKKLEYQFLRAQSAELAALKHRQTAELNELKQAQKSQFNEWFDKEKIARREFLKTHHKGEEIRTYLSDLKMRRAAMLKAQEEERIRRVRENEVRLKSAREDQAMRSKEFHKYLSKGEVPPASLWPENHY